MLIISDTSVLIDVECSGLTKAMFSLPWQFGVPDILFVKELSTKHAHLLDFGLISITMNGNQISEVYNLRQKYIKTSVNDLLALILAKHADCPLLTGDKALKGVAEQLNVQVHGTIWLVQQMIQHNIISVENARVAFDRMRSAGSRLPWKEIDRILNLQILERAEQYV